jgi:hypothetical protein
MCFEAPSKSGIDAGRAVLSGGISAIPYTVDIVKKNIHPMKLPKESRKSGNGEKYKVVERL